MTMPAVQLGHRAADLLELQVPTGVVLDASLLSKGA